MSLPLVQSSQAVTQSQNTEATDRSLLPLAERIKFFKAQIAQQEAVEHDLKHVTKASTTPLPLQAKISESTHENQIEQQKPAPQVVIRVTEASTLPSQDKVVESATLILRGPSLDSTDDVPEHFQFLERKYKSHLENLFEFKNKPTWADLEQLDKRRGSLGEDSLASLKNLETMQPWPEESW